MAARDRVDRVVMLLGLLESRDVDRVAPMFRALGPVVRAGDFNGRRERRDGWRRPVLRRLAG